MSPHFSLQNSSCTVSAYHLASACMLMIDPTAVAALSSLQSIFGSFGSIQDWNDGEMAGTLAICTAKVYYEKLGKLFSMISAVDCPSCASSRISTQLGRAIVQYLCGPIGARAVKSLLLSQIDEAPAADHHSFTAYCYNH